MMDLSDGLGLDLHRLADASGVGFELTEVPVADGATFDEAVGGGEDYELLIATDDAARLRLIFLDRHLAAPITIGRVVADVGRRTYQGGDFAASGWLHQL
jgi:thiamine-monophosphate kinase